MDHSYEEIRNVAIDSLAGREKTTYGADQFQHLLLFNAFFTIGIESSLIFTSTR
jgi:hypothetical protein